MKHKINYLDMLLIRQRLQAVMRKDAHTIDGKYKIRSLYFDNLWDKALREKIDGVNKREKFRIRYYNDDISVIHLEKKSKCSGLGSKQRDAISTEEAQAIVDGKYDWMIKCTGRPLVQELYSKIMSEGLKPKAIVDYDREPFIYDAGHVRVTLDYNIRTGLHCTDFLNPNCITVPAGDNSTIILEVKWDNFLPTIIRSIVQLENRSASAYSKYASCRIYG
jgi:hypothetical protein